MKIPSTRLSPPSGPIRGIHARTRFLAILPMTGALTAFPPAANAQVTTNFNKGSGNFSWADASNWDNGVPGALDTAVWQKQSGSFGAKIAVDTKLAVATDPLAVTSLKAPAVSQNPHVTLFHSDHLAPNNDPIANDTDFTPVLPATTLIEAAEASPKLIIAGSTDFSKEGRYTYYMPVEVGDYYNHGANADFYGPLTITGTEFRQEGRVDTSDQVNFRNTVDASGSGQRIRIHSNGGTINAHDTVTTPTILIDSTRGTYNAKAGDSSGGAGATITVNAGVLNFEAPQTTFPAQINVAAFAVAGGDFTGADYATNVSLADDAILTMTVNEPVDATPGVFDAKYWRGVTSKANDAITEGGDGDGGSIYKGVAVGPWAAGDMHGTIQAPTGVSELEVVIAYAQTRFTANSEMLMTDTGTTRTANIEVLPGARLYMDGGAINQNSTADPDLQVTTFNVTGQGGEDTTLHLNNLAVKAGQTYHLYNGAAFTNTNGQGNYGTVVLHDGAGFGCGGSLAFKDQANAGQYVFEDGSVILLNSNLQNSLAQDGATVTSGADDTGFFWIHGETIACFDSNRTVSITEGSATADIIKACNVSLSNNNAYRFGDYGLHLGDGKYLLLERDVDSAANGTTFIGTDPGSSSVGIAAEPGSNHFIAAPFDCNGATLVIGSDSPLTFVNDATNSWNQRDTAMATGTVRLTGGLLNANQVDIRSGSLNLNSVQDLGSTDVMIGAGGTLIAGSAVTIGKLAGNGTVSSAVNLTYGTVAPGASVGTLDMGAFTIPTGATYECEISGTGAVAGTDNDLILGTNVTVTDTWNLHLVNTGIATGTMTGSEVFTLVDADSVTNFVDTNVTLTASGFDLSNAVIAESGGNITITGLQATIVGGYTFADWIAGFTLSDMTFDGDADGDGIANGIEGFFGTDPGIGNPGLVAGSKEGDVFTFTHPKANLPLDDVTASYQWSLDLVNWHASDETDGGTTVTISASPNTPSAGTTTVTATASGTIPAKLFVQVTATQG